MFSLFSSSPLVLYVDHSSAATELGRWLCDRTGDPRYYAAPLSSDLRTSNATHAITSPSSAARASPTPAPPSPITSSPAAAATTSAVARLASTYINFETFADLAGYSGSDARVAVDRDRVFGGSACAPLMADRNWDLRRGGSTRSAPPCQSYSPNGARFCAAESNLPFPAE